MYKEECTLKVVGVWDFEATMSEPPGVIGPLQVIGPSYISAVPLQPSYRTTTHQAKLSDYSTLHELSDHTCTVYYKTMLARRAR